MELTGKLEPNIAPAEVKMTSLAAGYVVNVAMVYQDLVTRDWAEEVSGHVAQLVGQETVRCSSWAISELNQPRILEEAVAAAAGADLVVVSMHAADMLPVGLCAWIDAWLPRRRAGEGALAALVDSPQSASAPSRHAQECLRAVARQGQMDFLLRERVVSAARPEFPDWEPTWGSVRHQDFKVQACI